MAAPSLRAVAVRSGPLATLAPSCLAAAWAPLLNRTDLAARGAAGFSSSSAAAAATGGGGSSGPDAFTAALQQKTEEELRQLALKQAQPDAADDAEAAADEGQQSKVSAGRQGPDAPPLLNGVAATCPLGSRLSASAVGCCHLKAAATGRFKAPAPCACRSPAHCSRRARTPSRRTASENLAATRGPSQPATPEPARATGRSRGG